MNHALGVFVKIARYTVRSSEAGKNLQDFLTARLGLSRRGAKNLLDARSVLVNRRRVWMAKHPLEAGDEVETQEVAKVESKQPSPKDVRILHQDDSYLIVDKPPGILSNGPGGVEELLRKKLGADTLRAVHRLDKETSGCILFAKDEAAFDAMVPLFKRRSVKKQYHVIALGRVAFESTTVTVPIDGEPAVTHLRNVDVGRDASHLVATIETGRTHQIRRHLDSIGHPVVGDRRYGTRFGESDATVSVARQMLHSWLIEFVHPITGVKIRVQAPIPADFRSCMTTLKLK